MTRVIFIDTSPLGEITHTRVNPVVKDWVQFIKGRKIHLRVAEINDYELRRELILNNFSKSINRLDRFRQTQQIVPLTSEMLVQAAELWAWLRSQGQGTDNNSRLDGDVILAAQAISYLKYYDEVIIVTNNIRHISRFRDFDLRTWSWEQALLDCQSNTITLYN